MNTRLIYVREEEMSEELGAMLAQHTSVNEYLLFLVELKAVDDHNVPMISDLSDLRLNKAEQVIKEWLEDFVAPDLNWKLVVFEGKPAKNNPDFTFGSKFHKINVFVHPENELRLIPFLKNRVEPNKLYFFNFDQFNTRNLV